MLRRYRRRDVPDPEVNSAIHPQPMASAIAIFVDAFLVPFDRDEVRA